MTRATGLVTTTDLPAVASHPFYQRLNKLPREHGFDDFGPGGSIAEDLGSERMAKQVRPSGGRINSGTSGAEARGPTDVAASLLMDSSAETSRQASRRRPALFFLQSGPWVGRH